MIMQEVFNPAEKKIGSARQRSSRELNALLEKIDYSESRDGLRRRKSRSRKRVNAPKKAIKRKRDTSCASLDAGRRKLRKRSKARSPSSRVCTSLSKRKKSKRKHHRHHREHQQPDSASAPRVNPIFLWIKQDNTKIVEVLCEDYDKRNRIRLTKTPNGWRAIPRTERLVSAINQSNLAKESLLSSSSELVNGKPLNNVADSTESDVYEAKDDHHGASNDENHNNKQLYVYNSHNEDEDEEFDDDDEDDDEDDDVDIDIDVEVDECDIENREGEDEKVCAIEKCENIVKSGDSTYTENNHKGHKGVENSSESPRLADIVSCKEDRTPGPQRLLEDSCSDLTKSRNIESTEGGRADINDEEDTLGEFDDRVRDTSTEEVAASVSSNLGATICNLKEGITPQTSSNDNVGIVFNEQPSPCRDSEDTDIPNVESDIDQEELCITDGMQSSLCLDKNIYSCADPVEKDKKTHANTPEEIFAVSPPASKTSGSLNESIVQNPSQVRVDKIKQEIPCSNVDVLDNSEQPILSDKPICFSEVAVKLEKKDNVDICNNFIPFVKDTASVERHEAPEIADESPGKEMEKVSPTGLESDNSCTEEGTAVCEPSNPCKKIVNIPSSDGKQNVPDIKINAKTEEARKNCTEIGRSVNNTDEDFRVYKKKETDGNFENNVKSVHTDCKKLTKENSLDSLINLDESDGDTPLHQKLRLPEGTTICHIKKTMKQPISATSITPQPAHKHSQSHPNFLETLLSYPRNCHQRSSLSVTKTIDEPLDLGKSSRISSASPTITCSTDIKKSSCDMKSRLQNPNDITLRSILSQSKTQGSEKKTKKCDLQDEEPTVDSTTRSKLLELLTNKHSFPDSNPLAQLKDVMSNPDLVVPDPLLVPRARLPALIASPAREIPRLLSQKSEQKSFPKPISDPDLLVVSLAHLQSLLQKSGNNAEDWLKYQQQAQYIHSQMKQDQFNSGLDPASASALNQMLWLPYLNQMEASPVGYGNNQELLNMLSMIVPPQNNFYQTNPFTVTPPTTPPTNPVDFQQQMEFLKALNMWQDSLIKSPSNQFIHDFHNNNISSKPLPAVDPNMNAIAAQYYRNLFETSYGGSMTSARTNPISPNYQKNRPRYPTNDQHHLGQNPFMHQTPVKSTNSHFRSSSVINHPYSAPSRSVNNHKIHLSPTLKTETSRSSSKEATLSQERHRLSSNLQDDVAHPFVHKSKLKKQEFDLKVKPTSSLLPNLNIEIPNMEKLPQNTAFMSPPLTREGPVDLSEIKKLPSVPKLKVKQHLVDPNAKPKLLKIEDHPEVGSTTNGEEDPHLQLWHPFFGSQENNYRSPWQWTTPVTVSSE